MCKTCMDAFKFNKEVDNMASYFNNNFYNASGLFNSFFGSSSTSNTASSSMNVFADYASIKNGSYGKLLKSYYGGSNTAKRLVDDKDSTTTNAADKINATKNRDNASALKDALAPLLEEDEKKSLFVKKDIKAEDGTVTNDYDRDAIHKAVAAFADKYNEFIDEAADSDNTSVLRTTGNMVNSVRANKKLLADVGITIGSNNKLTVNAEKLNKADINKLKTLFNGDYSVAGRVEKSASQVYNQSVSELASKKSLYTASGTYDYSGYTYNRYL